MGKEIKACVFCRHCDYSPPITYSECTSEDESYRCDKGHFSYEYSESMGEGKVYRIALECKDFDLKDEIKEYLKDK